jgi:transposase InsO family protein
VSVIDCCTREIVGWNLSHRCRTEDALAAVEQVVHNLAVSPARLRCRMITPALTFYIAEQFRALLTIFIEFGIALGLLFRRSRIWAIRLGLLLATGQNFLTDLHSACSSTRCRSPISHLSPGLARRSLYFTTVTVASARACVG